MLRQLGWRARRLTRALVTLAAAPVFLVACGASVDSGGMTAGDRRAAQLAMNAIQRSNISIQLVGLTTVAGRAPAACRVHVISRKAQRFRVYVFWVPYDAARPYTWFSMTIGQDPEQDTFHLGTAPAQPPSGRHASSRAEIDNRVMLAHAGSAFTKPGANCQVLMNGYLRLVANA